MLFVPTSGFPKNYHRVTCPAHIEIIDVHTSNINFHVFFIFILFFISVAWQPSPWVIYKKKILIFKSNVGYLGGKLAKSNYFEPFLYSVFDVLCSKNGQNRKNDVNFLCFVKLSMFFHSNHIFFMLYQVPVVSMGHLYTFKQKIDDF